MSVGQGWAVWAVESQGGGGPSLYQARPLPTEGCSAVEKAQGCRSWLETPCGDVGWTPDSSHQLCGPSRLWVVKMESLVSVWGSAVWCFSSGPPTLLAPSTPSFPGSFPVCCHSVLPDTGPWTSLWKNGIEEENPAPFPGSLVPKGQL